VRALGNKNKTKITNLISSNKNKQNYTKQQTPWALINNLEFKHTNGASYEK